MTEKPSATGARRTKSPRRSYHHGDLKSALIDAAVQLIAERGVHEFSLAAASRRLGVAASAPYAHFADRDALLAAVAAHGLAAFEAELEARTKEERGPRRRLVAITRAYVEFAGSNKALFATLFEASVDKERYSDIAEGEQRIDDAFRHSVRRLLDSDDEASIERVASAVEALAHGNATLLLDGRFGTGQAAIETASDSAARSTAALINGRRQLLGDR